MNVRRATWLAWGLCVLVLALIACAVVFAALNNSSVWSKTFLIPVALAAVVGGMIASHRPTNLVGWLISGHALCFALGEFTRQYALYGIITAPGALPLARVMASPPYWIWFPGLILGIAFLPLYFPNGRLVSRRWRLVVLLAIFAGAIATSFAALQPNDGETQGIPNPLGIDDLQRFERFGFLIGALWLSVGFASVVSLVVRFRRARSEERQQIKWLMYALVLLIAYELIRQLILYLLDFTVPPNLGDVVFGSLWVAIAIAILRYRLYDIDIIINRTLVYGILTALLAAIYFSSVVVLQKILSPLIGGNDQLAIVASTLAVAALFNPLRRRIQSFIDRRFYRSKYDAAKTLEAFSAKLRDETDLDALSDDLVGVVRETMQPSHVSLWLRPDTPRESGQAD